MAGTVRAGAHTDSAFWDDYWERLSLPVEVARPTTAHESAILDVLDQFLPADRTATVAEVGGAPGAYLAYLHRTRRYRVASIDYSPVGCARTVENFRLLNVAGDVYQADIFDDTSGLPTFDAVFSLGLIEHFSDLRLVVERHIRLVRPGGVLVLGVPNLRGLHGWFLRHLAPTLYGAHEIEAMDLSGWKRFEDTFDLEVLFKGYVGGFEPRIFRRMEVRSPVNHALRGIAVLLDIVAHRMAPVVRKLNGPRASGYAIAAYRVPR
jgi:SAM-dependent methyltransferase